MSELHLLSAYAAAALALAILGASVATLATGAQMRHWLDRAILVGILVLLAAALTGLPLVLLVGLPEDPLHLLYGLAAPLVLLGGRYLGRAGSMRRRGAFVGVAALALLGVVYRLFTTAG